MRHHDFARLAHRITYLRSEANYTFVHFIDERPVLYSRTLLDCLPYLPNLIRLHQSYAANPDYIVEYRPISSEHTDEVRIGQIWLPLSRRRRLDVLHALYELTPPGQITGLPTLRILIRKPGRTPRS